MLNCSGSTVVEHSPHHPEVVGLITATRRERMAKKQFQSYYITYDFSNSDKIQSNFNIFFAKMKWSIYFWKHASRYPWTFGRAHVIKTNWISSRNKKIIFRFKTSHFLLYRVSLTTIVMFASHAVIFKAYLHIWFQGTISH
jgi:hypothetical protein